MTADAVYVADKRLLCGPPLTLTFPAIPIVESAWTKKR